MIESDVVKFVNKLPELTPDTVHLIMLAIRSRLAKEKMGFKIKDLVVERKVIRSSISQGGMDWRDRYLDVVKNFSTLRDHGTFRIKDVRAPSECMAIYGTISPRAVIPSVVSLIKDDMDYLSSGSDDAKIQLSKQWPMFFGQLHSHRAGGHLYTTLDIDEKHQPFYDGVRELVGNARIPLWMSIETARGWHLILNITRGEDAKKFYAPHPDGSPSICKQIMDKWPDVIDLQRDSQEPIPGTRYGDGYIKIVEG